MKAHGIIKRSFFKYRLSILLETHLQITEDRRKRVIDLYFNRHKTYAEIAEIERISPRDIHAIIREEETRRQKYQHQQKQEEISSKAYELFSGGKNPVEVAIALNLREPDATKYYREYWQLKRLDKLYSTYNELGDEGIRDFLKLYKLVKKERMGIEQVVKILQLVDEDDDIGLSSIEKLRKWRIDEIRDLDMQIERSKNHLQSVNDETASARALLNSYHISCERKRQEAVTLNNEISMLDTLVNLCQSNNEGYSKLKQIVKENVKAVLSENKQIISVSFAALIQTLKTDPQMINIIYKILTANDDEQHEDNNNNNDNAIKYLESNKDNILDLAEKNYENLVEGLTNNAISNASSHPTLSLPSSSIFSNLFNQCVPSK